MAQITFILQVPGGPPAQRVEHVDDADMNEFLDSLIATQFPGLSRKAAAEAYINLMFDDLNKTSRSAKIKAATFKGVLAP